MNVVVKKFQLISVGSMVWSEEYHQKLLSDGYELISENEDNKNYALKEERSEDDNQRT